MTYELALIAGLTLKGGITLTKNGIKKMISEIAKLLKDESINDYSLKVTDDLILEQGKKVILLVRQFKKKKGFTEKI